MTYVNCGDDSACCDVQLYSVLDTVVISGDDVCCSVVFKTLIDVFMWSTREWIVRLHLR